jgi:hypothetical protein
LPTQGFSNYDPSPFQLVLKQNLKKLGIDKDYISLQLNKQPEGADCARL